MENKIEIEEILNLLPDEIPTDKILITIDGNQLDINKTRFFNFKKSITCECCGTKGLFFHKDSASKGNYTLNLYGIKDGQYVVLSCVTEKAINPKYKIGTVLCRDCMHKYISHNKSKGIKNRTSDWENYNNQQDIPNNPFADLLKNFKTSEE